MLQILNWLCLISVSFLSFQVFSYMCKDAIKLYKSIIKTKKVYSKDSYSNGYRRIIEKSCKIIKKSVDGFIFWWYSITCPRERGREIRNLAEK